MKVILLKDIKQLGRAGEIVEVANGYGRNFIIPNRLGRLADKQTIIHAQEQAKRQQTLASRAEKEAERAKRKLSDITLTFELSAPKVGKLYAGLKADQILAKIKQTVRNLSEGAKLVDYSPIKEFGEHLVTLELAHGVIISIKVKIITANAEK